MAALGVKTMAFQELPEAFFISTDRFLFDLDVIHGFLRMSYWAKDISRQLVQRSMDNSLCFGVYEDMGDDAVAQVGFARVISDLATFAYLADVFILPEYRGRGLSKALVQAVVDHPDLQGLRRWMLITLDAHGLYEQVGFSNILHAERHMEIHRPGMYTASGA